MILALFLSCPRSESLQVAEEGKSKIIYIDVAFDLRKYKKLFTHATNAADFTYFSFTENLQTISSGDKNYFHDP